MRPPAPLPLNLSLTLLGVLSLALAANTAEASVSLTAAGADRLRPEVDGSISAGFGVGNPRTAVGVELADNLLSIRNFAENGSFDAKIHREVFANTTTQTAVAVGWNNFASRFRSHIYGGLWV